MQRRSNTRWIEVIGWILMGGAFLITCTISVLPTGWLNLFWASHLWCLMVIGNILLLVDHMLNAEHEYKECNPVLQAVSLFTLLCWGAGLVLMVYGGINVLALLLEPESPSHYHHSRQYPLFDLLACLYYLLLTAWQSAQWLFFSKCLMNSGSKKETLINVKSEQKPTFPLKSPALKQ